MFVRTMMLTLSLLSVHSFANDEEWLATLRRFSGSRYTLRLLQQVARGEIGRLCGSGEWLPKEQREAALSGALQRRAAEDAEPDSGEEEDDDDDGAENEESTAGQWEGYEERTYTSPVGSECTYYYRQAAKREFGCSICGKVYDRLNSLEYDLLRHLEEKPHNCEKCPASFYQECDKRRHKKRHHPSFQDDDDEEI